MEPGLAVSRKSVPSFVGDEFSFLKVGSVYLVWCSGEGGGGVEFYFNASTANCKLLKSSLQTLQHFHWRVHCRRNGRLEGIQLVLSHGNPSTNQPHQPHPHSWKAIPAPPPILGRQYQPHPQRDYTVRLNLYICTQLYIFLSIQLLQFVQHCIILLLKITIQLQYIIQSSASKYKQKKEHRTIQACSKKLLNQ